MKGLLTEVTRRRRRAAGIVWGMALATALFWGVPIEAQTQASASISGQVTDGERGLGGVVMALFSFEQGQRPRVIARAKTDHDGRYRFDGVRPGRYRLLPHTPALISSERGENWPPGAKSLSVLAGDSIEDIDFQLTQGGVITGRVTDAHGQPIVGEPIKVLPGPNTHAGTQAFNPFPIMTDDRGMYRVYGLTPGHYRVSVGGGPARFGGPRRHYPLTFHPDATDEARGVLVEVTAGGEAENIDISVGRPVKTFRAAGRVVSAETGQPIAGLRVGIGPVESSSQRVIGFIAGGVTNSPRGEFAIHQLVPGRYAAFVVDGEGGYSDPVIFNLGSADVTGLELRLKRGASVSGGVQVEGIGDRATLARLLADVQVIALHEPGGNLIASRPPASAPVANGTFHLSGLRPGKLRINIMTRTPGLTVARVESNGADLLRAGVELAEGAHLSGVRVVLVYGTGIMRGQVALEGASLPPNVRVIVSARRIGSEPVFLRQTSADAGGRFQFEGLPAGTYEVSARAFGPNTRTQRFEGRPQQIFIADGAEQQVLLSVEPVPTTPAP
jgi:hypothetical protein